MIQYINSSYLSNYIIFYKLKLKFILIVNYLNI